MNLRTPQLRGKGKEAVSSVKSTARRSGPTVMEENTPLTRGTVPRFDTPSSDVDDSVVGLMTPGIKLQKTPAPRRKVRVDKVVAAAPHSKEEQPATAKPAVKVATSSTIVPAAGKYNLRNRSSKK